MSSATAAEEHTGASGSPQPTQCGISASAVVAPRGRAAVHRRVNDVARRQGPVAHQLLTHVECLARHPGRSPTQPWSAGTQASADGVQDCGAASPACRCNTRSSARLACGSTPGARQLEVAGAGIRVDKRPRQSMACRIGWSSRPVPLPRRVIHPIPSLPRTYFITEAYWQGFRWQRPRAGPGWALSALSDGNPQLSDICFRDDPVARLALTRTGQQCLL